MAQRFNVGDIVTLTDEAKTNYEDFEWATKELRVISVATSKADHPGYDEGLYPEALYDFETEDDCSDVSCSLYDWELK